MCISYDVMTILFIMNRWWNVEAFKVDMRLSNINLLLIWILRYFIVDRGIR